jgi:phosphohistidine phosphatase
MIVAQEGTMTMDLIFWRHADARDAHAHETDADRPLTGKGERQAQQMGDWLRRHLPASTQVLVSPALRTRQTAEALGRPYKVIAALAPGTTVAAVLHAARWPGSDGAVLVVGHQPTLGLAAATLLCGSAQPWSVRKGSVWWLRQRDGETTPTLMAVWAPDQLPAG